MLNYERVWSPWQRRQGLAGIVERVITYPIHRQRWAANRRMLLAELDDRTALTGSVAAALSLSAEIAVSQYLSQPFTLVMDGNDLQAESLQRWARDFRRVINEAVTMDLLGADWRRRRLLRRGVRPVRVEHDAWRQLEAVFEQCTTAERELIAAYLAHDGDGDAMAQRLQKTPEAVQRAMSRLRRKLAG